MKVVIILPTYNEAKNIETLIRQLQKVFLRLPQYDFAILVVDDNSPDQTAMIVKRLMREFSNVRLLSGEKRGLGAAYVRGMRYAIDRLKAEVFFEMDADLSHDPALIPAFLEKIAAGSDLVIGSRYMKGGSIPSNWAFHRKVFSLAGNLMVRFGLMLPGLKEWTSGYRAIKVAVFEDIKAGLSQFAGYTFQVAFLHRAIQKGFRVTETPLNFVDRKYGKSKIAPFNYISNVLLYILKNSSFIRFCFVGFLGFFINLLGLEFFFRLGIRPGPAAALGAEISIISNFLLNNFWTFEHKKIAAGGKILPKFLQFNFVSLGAILIQLTVVGAGTHFFGDQSRFVFLFLAVAFFVIPYSYFMYNRFIWKK